MEGFRSRWQSSPFADEYLGRLAMALIAGLQLGQQSSTDFLGVSFSALDRIGHDFGPLSHEVQDALVRLDATLGSLLDHLDRLIGPDHYVVALSADHGVSPVPEQLAEIGIDAGRIRAGDVVDRVDRALASVLGPGKYVARLFYTDLYFSPGVYDKLTSDPRAMAAALEALRATPGVAAVYRSDELTRGLYRDDGMAAAAALSYFAGRSGDLIVVPQPYWIVSSSAATHGSANSYDRAVPVVLMGGGIRPGQYLERASPADIAPTIAFLTGIVLPRPYGRVLTEALTLSP
jgi:predicted AlkP superfamily pyrophosphatase or phosphodiesterase